MTALFDERLLQQRLKRGVKAGYPRFLLDAMLADLSDRLVPLLRKYETALDFATPMAGASAVLQKAGVAQTVYRCGLHGADLFAGLEHVPFAAHSVGMIVSLGALHHANALPDVLTHIRQTLQPDGVFLGCLIGGESLLELRQSLLAADSAVYGGVSPRVAPMVEVRALGGLLQRAGFTLPVIDAERIRVRYSSVRDLAHDLRGMGATNALLARSKTPVSKGYWQRVEQEYKSRFADSDGRLPATFDLLWVSGWAPHESQQKPLKPGSAIRHLSEVL
jgi:SAM-dependent methyltransferase